MSWFAKKARRQPAHKHMELWGHLLESNRFLKRLAAGSVLLAFLGLGSGAYGMMLAVHKPLVFAVDGEGRATRLGRIRDLRGPIMAEVRYVAKRFLKSTMAFHSDTIESDMAEGFNLMTAELQDEMRAQFTAYKTERKMTFVAFVKKQRIRTVLEFQKMDAQNHNDKVWTVTVRGLAKTWPLNRVGEDAGVRKRAFEAQLTLASAPRTEQTPNGLLVAAQATRFFQVESKATLREHQVSPKGDARPFSKGKGQ